VFIFLNHFDLFIEFFDVDPELLIGIDQVIDGPAGMEDGGMVLIAAMDADGGKGRFRMFLGEIHSQLPGLDDLSLTCLGIDGIDRQVEIVANYFLDEVDGNLPGCTLDEFVDHLFGQVKGDRLFIK
jgi:hypothetical protein